MSIYLSDEDVRGLLETGEGLAAVEEGYREKVFEGSINRPRDNLWIGEGRKSLKVLSGTLQSLGLMGLMTYSGEFYVFFFPIASGLTTLMGLLAA